MQSIQWHEKVHNFGLFSPIWTFYTNLERATHFKQNLIHVMRPFEDVFHVKIAFKNKNSKFEIFRQITIGAAAFPCVALSFHEFYSKRSMA